MAMHPLRHIPWRRIGRVALRLAALVVLLLFGAHLLLKTVAATPWAAAQTARLLSGFLHQPVTISGLAISGATLVADGIVIANPAGFGRGELVTCRVLRVTPVWRDILVGRRSFALIEIRGLGVTAGRNSAGAWNFGELVKQLSARKSPAETFVKKLMLEDASFTIAGRKAEGISLAVTDLATKGSTPSRLLLTCRDLNGNAYRLEGTARLGAAPAVDLSLVAPSLSLRGLDRLVRTRLPFVTDKGTGGLALGAHFAQGRLEVRGNLGWTGLFWPVQGGNVPLRGTLAFSGSYDLKRDAAVLDNVSLNANDVLHLQGHASAERVRGECPFTGEVTGRGVELNDAQGFLPARLRKDITLRGSVVPGLIRFPGDRRHGVTGGSGSLTLRHGALFRGGRALLAEIAGEVSLARGRQEWLVRGRLFRQGRPVGVPLQDLRLPFSARLSSRFRPLAADAGPFAATVAEIPLKGEAAYRPAAPDPLSVRLEVPRVELTALNGYLASHNMKVTAGTGTVFFRGAGEFPDRFRGETRLALAGVAGTVGGRPVTLGEGGVQGTVSLAAKKVTATGTCKANAGAFDGKTIDGVFGYRLVDREITLSDGSCTIGGTNLRFAAIRSAIPASRRASGGGGLPLRLEFDWVDIGQGELRARGMTGSLAADLVSGAEGRWLEGAGSVAVPRVTFRDREVAALTGRFTFRKGEMAVALSGKALDGSLQGAARLDPFAKEPLPRFSLQVEGGRCSLLAGLAFRGEAVQPAGGTLDVRFVGSHSRKGGLRGNLTAAGRDIVLTGKGGRTLLADSRVVLTGELADGNLAVSGGSVSVGPDLALKFQGKLAHAAAPDRQGHLAVSIPPVPVASFLTAFVNLLPRPLQEANAAGTVAGRADVRLVGSDVALDGTLTVAGGALEIPGQKLDISGISGTVPVSLDLTRGGTGGVPKTSSATRKDYSRLLQNLRQTKQEGESFRIGKIRFGGVECGTTSLSVRAGNGLTEITSLKAELYGGELLGKGFLGYRHGAVYDGEFLVNGLSLKMFCDSYPAIKGYITGRLDGIMAFHREGAGLKGMTGAIDLWTRAGNHEKMLVSKEFLQKLAGKKLKGIFFRNDRPYDRGEISATLEKGYLTFNLLDIEHTHFFGVKDLSVTVVPVQNRIAVDHLISAIREAAARGKATKGEESPAEAPAEAPPATEFKWEE